MDQRNHHLVAVRTKALGRSGTCTPGSDRLVRSPTGHTPNSASPTTANGCWRVVGSALVPGQPVGPQHGQPSDDRVAVHRNHLPPGGEYGTLRRRTLHTAGDQPFPWAAPQRYVSEIGLRNSAANLGPATAEHAWSTHRSTVDTDKIDKREKPQVSGDEVEWAARDSNPEPEA